ncbi:MAG TPA: hypothetical protein VFX02_10625 [Gammaproteobacteria bacterium]|nr:hypothetical protein [Gammaproteobacteria bacterium]
MSRTTLLILGGSGLVGLFILMAVVLGDHSSNPLKAFIGLWVVVAFVNLFMGLMEQGPEHAFKEEIRHFLAILSVPVALAVMFPWKMLAM